MKKLFYKINKIFGWEFYDGLIIFIVVNFMGISFKNLKANMLMIIFLVKNLLINI